MTTATNPESGHIWDYLREVYLEPRRAFRTQIFESPVSHSMAWGLALAWIGTAVQTLILASTGKQVTWISEPFWNWFFTGLSLCFFPALLGAGIWFESLVLSWSSRWFSGSEQSLSLADSMRIEGTALVPLLFVMIPGLGGFIAAVWRFGLLITGVEVRLGVSRGRAIWIVIAPIFVAMTLLFGALLFAGILGALIV